MTKSQQVSLPTARGKYPMVSVTVIAGDDFLVHWGIGWVAEIEDPPLYDRNARVTVDASHGASGSRAAFVLVAQGVDSVEADKQRRREAVNLVFSNYADQFASVCKGRG